MQNHSIDSVINEVVLPFVVEQLEATARSEFLKFLGYASGAVSGAVAWYAGTNQPQGYSRLIIIPGLIALVYCGYKAVESLQAGYNAYLDGRRGKKAIEISKRAAGQSAKL